jgi:hypothetical protein
MLVEPETDGPDLLLLERPLRTNQTALVPGTKLLKGRVE